MAWELRRAVNGEYLVLGLDVSVGMEFWRVGGVREELWLGFERRVNQREGGEGLALFPFEDIDKT